jgi:hypothetical protein
LYSGTYKKALSVFDVILNYFNPSGKKIQTLVNEQLQPGSYEINFNGSDLASGMYFYKLASGDFTEIKSAVLIK